MQKETKKKEEDKSSHEHSHVKIGEKHRRRQSKNRELGKKQIGIIIE